MNELEKVIEKYFRDEKIKYFSTVDAIANEQYLSWSYFKHERNKILISIGSNDGEVQVKIFTDPEQLDLFIKIIIS